LSAELWRLLQIFWEKFRKKPLIRKVLEGRQKFAQSRLKTFHGPRAWPFA
jgi:hypothetical protein